MTGIEGSNALVVRHEDIEVGSGQPGERSYSGEGGEEHLCLYAVE
jgi:hypothetical protein